MLFQFLKYLHPTHYFQLYRKNGTSVFPKVEKLPDEILEQLETETRFQSEKAKEYDLSWQALQKGYIGDGPTYASFHKLPVVDEYRFLRKYFHPVWVLYVLMLRIFSFKNPFQEIAAWKKSSNVKRSDYLKQPFRYYGWISFKSALVSEKPFVSIVIPTLNRYEYLRDVLEDLEKQGHKNFEVIIVDQSNPFQEDFYKNFNLKIQLVQQTERALWLARNHAIKISKGEYILLFDDDSRVEADWITNHLKCLDFFKADISSGVSISASGAEVPKNYSFFRISDQIDTGNVLLKKQIFREIGLFDRQFEKQRMGDGEYGLRAYLNGCKNISNPFAGRIHLKVGSGGLREMGSWDAFRPKKLFAPRPIPSVLYLYRKYYGRKRSLLAILKTVPQSIIPYRYKKNKKMLVLGLFISLFLFPFVVLQVFISWRLASQKLREGAMIGELDY
ncbi:glycosyltransferase family 2 protein [Aequorivita antarctica]|uniref:Glycosyltransferase family 2 protein n=1 Tax=Aequorivita antarctica TaxID=153266 RepID=A0A5C6YZE4_9FLAO|nr:glycosyltransferase family A protein [Aequorivita antarctica]TXD72479.1 glycosyltransferase family 2 protein [Aequorivita antarctica]SRX75613.1 Putative glycosyltransferase EpsH [Aequorivita antarctica]